MSKYYFVGSGIASLAGAAYLIHDGDINGADISIFEESSELGGALDAHGNAKTGYFMTGGRMFEPKYNATFDLCSFIPSASDPRLSVKEETEQAEKDAPWHNRARLVNGDGKIAEFHEMGFSEKERIELLAIMARSEKSLDSKRISDCFDAAFFRTNFWYEWSTLFAFEKWHSAIEFRRYLLRFIHHFSTIDTQENIFRTRYCQYDSMVIPLVNWLKDKGVQFRTGTRVTDLGLKTAGSAITVNSIKYAAFGGEGNIPVAEGDFVFVTNGSMTADRSFGSMTEAPILESGKRAGAWRLWETIAAGRPEFGNPAAFDSHIEESRWESFTITLDDPLFFKLMQEFSGSEPGKGGLITFKDSNWLLTLSIYRQPYYKSQPENTFVCWGYALFHDKIGQYVKKTFAECAGREIFEELLGHLKFDEHKNQILASANVIPCTMPYITSQFLVRKAGDRPDVIPKGSTNLAFLGQFAELPDDVVFTVEYSIRSAQTAVYSLLKLDKKPSPFYKGVHNPLVLLEALETLHR
jgi:oleate hydratase